MDEWYPYVEDYPNFRLLSSVATRCNIDLSILYNVRTKEPFRDDVSRVKMFSFESGRPRLLGFFSLEEIVGDRHRTDNVRQGAAAAER